MAAEERPSDEEREASDELGDDTSLLDSHRDFILTIDDASRIGHSVLGGSTLAAVVLALIVSRQPVFSVASLLLVPAVAIVTLVVGRRVGLARQDRRLRERIRVYCLAEGVPLEELVREALDRQQFEFFVKLSLPLLGPEPRSGA